MSEQNINAGSPGAAGSAVFDGAETVTSDNRMRVVWTSPNTTCSAADEKTKIPDPSQDAMQLVRDWLWLSPVRETIGISWTEEQIRDTARMIDVAFIKAANIIRTGLDIKSSP